MMTLARTPFLAPKTLCCAVIALFCHSSNADSGGSQLLGGLDALGKPVDEVVTESYDMRGFGEVEATGRAWQIDGSKVSLVSFKAEDAEKAAIVASKFIADLQGYSVGKPVKSSRKHPWQGWTYSFTDAGIWVVGIEGDAVHALSGPSAAALAPAAEALGAETWSVPEQGVHPAYLDNFDLKSVSIWWKSKTKPQEILDWAVDREAIINAHVGDSISNQPVPNATGLAGWENTWAMGDMIDRENRAMLYAMRGPQWWYRSVDMRDHFESAVEGVQQGYNIFRSDLYQASQSTSPEANAVMGAVLYDIMDAADHDDIMAWKVPPGEWSVKDPAWNPPNARERYARYLQDEKGYTLKEANAAHGVQATSWEEFPYPETATFFGRRGEFIDLDGDWRWRARIGRDEGLRKGAQKPNFDDSEWLAAPHYSRRLAAIYRFLPGEERDTAPLWGRTAIDVPADFLQAGERTYLYAMPYTDRTGKAFYAWVNGREIEGQGLMESHENRCTVFDVTDVIKPGDNAIAIYSHGGRIKGRVWLGHTPPDRYPFAEQTLSQQLLDWTNFLYDAKLETVEFWLNAIRSEETDRPIKIMTGKAFLSDGQDLYVRYGAYVQLTGEGAYYQPMHYKGYGHLRGLPASSEGGNPGNTMEKMQRKFSWILWQGQDAHDYVFDIEQNVYSHQGRREWWEANEPMISTVGRTDFPHNDKIGLLRDTDQTFYYMNNGIWNWDLSRGALPGLGITPVLVGGRDIDKGYASEIPVLIDTSTRVMSDKRVESILEYVEEGGTFVAGFDTGRDSEFEKEAWPLAKKLGLKITDKSLKPDDFRDSPVLPLIFLKNQDLMPSLRGKTIEGMGVSINREDDKRVAEAVSISAPDADEVKPIAVWKDDGSIAVCEIPYGEGRIIWVGSPFYFRSKDVVGGNWINNSDRQELLEEFMAGLGIERKTSSEHEQMWISRRESKNGLYDVYFAAPMWNLPEDWEIDDKIVANFTIHDAPAGRDVAFEMTKRGRPKIRGKRIGSDLVSRDLTFRPHLVRQFAMVRDNVGLDGPLHWLRVQSRAWRALDLPDDIAGMRGELVAQAAEVAERLGQDGMPLTEDWKVRKISEREKVPADNWEAPAFDDASWENGRLGTWIGNGWNGLKAAQYRRTVDIPQDWLGNDRRVMFGFSDAVPLYMRTGVRDQAKLWINGRLLENGLSGSKPMIIDVTEKASAGKLDLAMEVQGDALNGGAGGTFYLWSLPKPKATLSLDGKWRIATDWDRENGAVTLPGSVDTGDGALGIRRQFELPAGWEGKTIRLVIDQDEEGNASGVILNDTGYFRDLPSTLYPYGVRVDHWLKPGSNEIDIYNDKHSDRDDHGKLAAAISDIRLEMYD